MRVIDDDDKTIAVFRKHFGFGFSREHYYPILAKLREELAEDSFDEIFDAVARHETKLNKEQESDV